MNSEEIWNLYHSSSKLQQVVPELKQVTPLSGGYTNFVYLLTGTTQMVLKYFAPFLRIQAQVPIKQDRYYVEKHSLLLVQRCNMGTLKVPKVLFFDDDKSLLGMEYCGSLQTLSELFEDKTVSFQEMQALNQELVDQLKLYKQEMTRISLSLTPEDEKVFENISRQVIFTTMVHPSYRQNAIKYNVLEEMSDVLDRLQPFKPTLDFPLSHGDLWPNSILFNKDKREFWLLDWEMAHRRHLDRDLDQMIANLWLMAKSDHYNQEAIRDLIQRISGLYPWLQTEASRDTFLRFAVDLPQYPHFHCKDPRTVILEAIDLVNKQK
ncbi:kinase-like domain-containing protein [Gorgonomyces haynaldii]|nr:kinase-like domain-containing protein [Gorgonomyces haynaldii]